MKPPGLLRCALACVLWAWLLSCLLPTPARAYGVTYGDTTSAIIGAYFGGGSCANTHFGSPAGALAACAVRNGYTFGGMSNCSTGGSSVACTCSWTIGPTPEYPNGRSGNIGCGYEVLPPEFMCPANASQVGSTAECRCNAGHRPKLGVANECEAYTCTAGALESDDRGIAGNVAQGLSVCMDGCKAAGTYGATGPDGRFWVHGDPGFRLSGDRCEGGGGGAGDVNTPPSPEHDGASGERGQCAARGQCAVHLSDRDVCIPCATTTQPGTTTTNPDGSTTTTNTVCDLATGKCTTTTTTAPGTTGGSCTPGPCGTSTKDDPLARFCQENPESAICKKSSISGSCSSVACDGDPVQCAMAKEQARRNCEFFEPTGPTVQAGIDGANGQARPTGHPANTPETVNVGPGSFDTSNPLGGSCPADRTFNAGAATFTIPFSNLCPFLTAMGQFAVAMSLIAGVMIAFRQ